MRQSPVKSAAHAAVARAIREGVLSHPKRCEACGRLPYVMPKGRWMKTGRPGLVWHHHDYAKPLDVIGLCRSCHSNVHEGNIPEPRTGRIYPPVPALRRAWPPSAILSAVAHRLPGERVPFVRTETREIAELVVAAHGLRERRPHEDWRTHAQRDRHAAADLFARLRSAGLPAKAAS